MFVRLGAAGVFFNSSAKLSIAGQPLLGGSAHATNNATGVLGLGAYLLPNVTLNLLLGVPPVSKLVGTGTAAPFGALGKASYGPAVLSLDYHFDIPGTSVRPYLGAGLAYYVVFNTEDRAVRQLKVGNTFGAALEGGAEYMIAEHWGIFVEVKKIWLQPKATGVALPPSGRVPVSAKATLDPLVASAGAVFRF